MLKTTGVKKQTDSHGAEFNNWTIADSLVFNKVRLIFNVWSG